MLPGPTVPALLPLLTAQEAFPAFEEAVLDAHEEIVCGFRIFDFATRLRSPRARAVGADWFDLILDALRRGVTFRLVLSDFDAVVGEHLHGLTWRSLRAAAALRELAPPGAQLDVSAALHPARLAWPVRLALWPKVQLMLGARTRSLAQMPEGARARYLLDHPGVMRMLRVQGARLRPRRLFLPDLAQVTHHQKLAVIDGRRLYCGGLDLNERRFDTLAHDRPAEETWHDVQVMIDDPAMAQVARAHLETFVSATHRHAPPSPSSGGVLRTLSACAAGTGNSFAPRRLLTELEAETLRGIAAARDLIYIETQFLRSRRIAGALARAARRNPQLRLFLILPGAPEDVAFEQSDRSDARFGEYLQAICVARLRRAFGTRLFIGAPVRRVAATSRGRDTLYGAPLIYVHAKVSIFDETLAVISSANLNGRSLRWDTEFGVKISDPAQVRALRDRLLRHWLDDAEAERLVSAESCVAAWRAQAARNAHSTPSARLGFLVPYRSGPGRRFGRDLPVIPEEMV
ncbi:phospholipase D-like domain-containing protein [Jannaschia sp. M317]|uniref:phospholipase D-like domain-containing protein n=1 Tax=Jannaschia sp. M317 TaxID=2867011 RepID=UPI0021A45550|nr:phospholipase D-like domain-containing protein [Jannaschia sp. M317]UWQ18992.1 phospholipase [Jannaschia sp. M317]